MLDDDRLDALLATGVVVNETFNLTRTANVTRDGTLIHNCDFANKDGSARAFLNISASNVVVTNCKLGVRVYDEMSTLYDMLDEPR